MNEQDQNQHQHAGHQVTVNFSLSLTAAGFFCGSEVSLQELWGGWELGSTPPGRLLQSGAAGFLVESGA